MPGEKDKEQSISTENMPKMRSEFKTNEQVREFLSEFRQFAEENPEVDEKRKYYEAKLQELDDEKPNWADDIEDIILVGNKTYKEMLDENTDYMAMNSRDIMVAQATLMDITHKKKSVFHYMKLDEKGDIQAIPIVESNGQEKTPINKFALGLLDRFCLLFGYKTENYKLYEAQQHFQQKSIEKKKEQCIEDNEEEIKKEKAFLKDAGDHAQEWESKLNLCLFGKEKVDDWVLPDGSRLSATAVALGVLSSKEVGAEGIWEFLSKEPEDAFDEMQVKYSEEFGKAADICKNLLKERDQAMQLHNKFKHLDNNLFEKPLDFRLNEDMTQNLREKLTPAIDTQFLSGFNNKLVTAIPRSANSPTNHEYNLAALTAKKQLYGALKLDGYAPTLTEELAAGEMLKAKLKTKLYSAVKNDNLEQIKALNDMALESSVYCDSLKNIQMAQFKAEALGKEVADMTPADLRSIKNRVREELKNAGLTKDDNPLHAYRTADLILRYPNPIVARLTIALDEHCKLEGMQFGLDENPLPYDIREGRNLNKIVPKIGGTLMDDKKMQMQFDFGRHLQYDNATQEYTLDKEAFSADAEEYENSLQPEESSSNPLVDDEPEYDSEYEDDMVY